MATHDVIELRGLRVAGIVGVLAHERTQAQPLDLDLDIVLDLGAAGRSDDLADTVDYGALCAVAEQIVTTTSFALLEALAERIASSLLEVDARVDSVTVWVRKLRPPVAQHLATSGVRVTRTRT
ncbi:MAG: dihydroneopterin aldolase [Acidimicrobiales bacterium]